MKLVPITITSRLRKSLDNLSEAPKIVSLVVVIILYNIKAETLLCDGPPCSPRISTNQKWLHSMGGGNVFRHEYFDCSTNALQNYLWFLCEVYCIAQNTLCIIYVRKYASTKTPAHGSNVQVCSGKRMELKSNIQSCGYKLTGLQEITRKISFNVTKLSLYIRVALLVCHVKEYILKWKHAANCHSYHATLGIYTCCG